MDSGFGFFVVVVVFLIHFPTIYLSQMKPPLSLQVSFSSISTFCVPFLLSFSLLFPFCVPSLPFSFLFPPF